MATKKTTSNSAVVTIAPPNFETAEFRIIGDVPLVIQAFSRRKRDLMHSTQEAGSTARGKKKRTAKDFRADFEDAKHKSAAGWEGIAASAFRCACISACRLVGFKMTLAKLSVFIVADGYDELDNTPLVKIRKGKAEYAEHVVRNATGVADLRARPMYMPGWEATLRTRWDADQFTLQDVTNLLHRVGAQVGIGEGRPDSKNSAGMGWGLFHVATEKEARK